MYHLHKTKFLKKYNEIFLFNKTFFNSNILNHVRSNLIKTFKNKIRRKMRSGILLRFVLVKNYQYFCRKNILLLLTGLHYDLIKLFFNKKRFNGSLFSIAPYYYLFVKFIIRFILFKFSNTLTNYYNIAFLKIYLILLLKLLNIIFPSLNNKLKIIFNLLFIKCIRLLLNKFKYQNNTVAFVVNTYMKITKNSNIIVNNKICFNFLMLKQINVYKI